MQLSDDGEGVCFIATCWLLGWLLQAKPVKRRISFEQFLDVIAACADKKGVETRDLLHIILNKGGPESSGAKAQSVRLYDDKVCSALKPREWGTAS